MSEQYQDNMDQKEELYQLFGSLCNETITSDEHQRLEGILADDAHTRQLYYQYLDLHLELGEPTTKQSLTHRSSSPEPTIKHYYLLVGVALLVLLTITIGLKLNNLNNTQQTIEHNPLASVVQTSQVRFAVGSPSLKVGSPLEEQKKYALVEGELQIIFNNGAEVILQGPAVFEVLGKESLSVDYGACSVYAPEGAEGFVVQTPLSHVVDLGTRFSVNVNESGETDVQVVEGEAEVHPVDSKEIGNQQTIRLSKGMAQRYTRDQKIIAQNIPYDQTSYSKQLPDRVMNYTATTGQHGGVEKLTEITLQRGGKKITYSTDQLIGIEVIHFKGVPSGRGYFTTGLNHGDPALNQKGNKLRRGLLDADRLLTTGLINPGGSVQPLKTNPVINKPEIKDHPNTPGMAIRFKTPVINGPGADVVLFDLHVIVHPVHGDHFHVSPIHFREGLHSHTIRQFDINLSSAEAKNIDKFRLYSFEKIVGDLDQLESFKHNGGMLHVVGAKALATGIDLSDLGYKPGEAVEELFIQDALSKGGHLDPVFIAGLPEIIDNSK